MESRNTAPLDTFVPPALQPWERLLCLSNQSPAPPPEELARAAASINAGDWAAFAAAAEFNHAVPLTLNSLRSAGLERHLPGHWAGAEAVVRRAGRLRFQNMQRCLEAFQAAGLECAILKGGFLGPEIYRNPGYKRMNDCDILVRENDVGKVKFTLLQLGFRSPGELFRSEGRKAKNHHTTPFVSSDLGCVIGIHWNLCSPYAAWKPDIDGIWRRAGSFDFGGSRAMRLAWEDNLLHLCIHLPFYKTGLRELADIRNLIFHAGERLDWEVLRARCTRWRADDGAYRALRLTEALFPGTVRHAFLAACRTASRRDTVQDTDRRCLSGRYLLASRSVQIGRIEKAVSIMRLSAHPRESVQGFLGMWRHFLFMPQEEVHRITMTAHAPGGAWRRLAYRAKALRGLWNAMGRDYGFKALNVMFVMNHAVALKAFFRSLHPFPRAIRLTADPLYRVLEQLE